MAISQKRTTVSGSNYGKSPWGKGETKEKVKKIFPRPTSSNSDSLCLQGQEKKGNLRSAGWGGWKGGHNRVDA